ncbi:predicted protein [Naegleria gruberi]|uniref:Predicted protein n=1 Tax=Naegleria gruberi TaxID=5762 RepID=D2VRT6_NAEGR|nr:uncharacterized protein NAEGRDRAFT_51750 [Naegleria gruberi]EFC40521.1 predicted protein [Naegleria gruberi]|eukprot:XP_002673265.1 predicted protein [Naegleria gruberi strain NEG-M]
MARSLSQTSSSSDISSSSWKARALKRAEERAKEAGVSVDAVLKEHWGDSSKNVATEYDKKTIEKMAQRESHRNKHFALDGNMRKPEFDLAPNTKIYEKYRNESRSESSSVNISRFGNTNEQTFMKYALMSNEELNSLAQRALDAEDRKDMKLYRELSDQLKEIRQCKETYKKHGSAAAQLPSFDSQGRRIDGGAQGRKYINNRDDSSLQDIYLEAKEHSVQDFDRNLANNIAKDSLYRSSNRNASEYDDQYSDFFKGNGSESFEVGDDRRSKKKQKTLEEKQKAFLQKNKMFELKKLNNVENCAFCVENKRFKNHLVIATGSKAYLTISPFGCLTEGHCCIVPIQHTISIRETDEDVYDEIMKFKLALKKLFVEQGRDIIFIETVTQYSMKHEKHAFIECIPVSEQQMEVAPSYFKNAILELGNTAYNLSASEWSDNKRFIETKGKGIHRSIPKGFPYFHVEFGVNGGFAHPISDEDFSFVFGKEVLCGIMKKTPNEAKLRAPRFEEEKQNAQKFSQQYSKYDFLKQQQ